MSDERWMRIALQEAAAAQAEGEVPIGAVVVRDGELIARAHNRPIALQDPTAHAEILALRQAARIIGNYRLTGTHLYTTVEPCAMCAGAAVWARVQRIVFGTRDEKGGAVVSKARLLSPGRFNHQVDFDEGVLAEECRRILQRFFSQRRRSKAGTNDPLPGLKTR